MEEQISIEELYIKLKKLEKALMEKGIITKNIDASDTALLSEKSLSKEWLSPEEDEAWKDL